MPQANDIAGALLAEYSELLMMTGGDALRARSYQKAARAVAGHSADISGLGPAAQNQLVNAGWNNQQINQTFAGAGQGNKNSIAALQKVLGQELHPEHPPDDKGQERCIDAAVWRGGAGVPVRAGQERPATEPV
jgi:Helix-hairpin-helix domain